MSAEDTPLVAGKIIGYRFWITKDYAGNLGLFSVYALANSPYEWKPRINEAHCRALVLPWFKKPHHNPDHLALHLAPDPDCECGFYALHSIDSSRLQILVSSHQKYNHKYVRGAIAAWGKVQVHREGFRAQYAQIIGFLADDPLSHLFAERYGVGVYKSDDLVVHAQTIGEPLSPSLFPE
jgi:hypothetical protein